MNTMPYPTLIGGATTALADVAAPRRTCTCGHDDVLHDAYGCAAWLGAFADETPVEPLGYCECRTQRGDVIGKVAAPR
jgi:hypothetical protein